MQYVIIISYFALLIAIGIVASRRVSDLDDYYVGGKNLGYWVVAFSARASGESASTRRRLERSRAAALGCSASAFS